jgi:hypothetical protein
VVVQSQLRNDLGRTGKAEPTGVERHVIEGRVVNLGVEITPDVAALCLVFLPDKLGRFGFIQLDRVLLSHKELSLLLGGIDLTYTRRTGIE